MLARKPRSITDDVTVAQLADHGVSLPPRCLNALLHGGPLCVGEIRDASDALLLSLRHFGRVSLSEVRLRLGSSRSGSHPGFRLSRPDAVSAVRYQAGDESRAPQ